MKVSVQSTMVRLRRPRAFARRNTEEPPIGICGARQLLVTGFGIGGSRGLEDLEVIFGATFLEFTAEGVH